MDRDRVRIREDVPNCIVKSHGSLDQKRRKTYAVLLIGLPTHRDNGRSAWVWSSGLCRRRNRENLLFHFLGSISGEHHCAYEATRA